MELRTTPLSAHCGSVIHDIDPRTMDDTTLDVVLAELHDRGVIVFPGIGISEDDQLAIGARLGRLEPFPVAKLLGATGPSFQTIIDGPDSPPTADSWHTDATWLADPPRYAILTSLVATERGGDTMWASTASILAGLSPEIRDLVDGLDAWHDNTSFIEGMLEKMGRDETSLSLAEELRIHYPPVLHPLVIDHPGSGRPCLYLGGQFMRRIEGLRPAESEMLLEFLRTEVSDERHQCRWHWSPGDVAIWDEWSTNHRSAGDHFPQHRSIRRIEVRGGPPPGRRARTRN